MRLSDWATEAPNRESMAPKVMDILRPVLAGLGAATNPSCWVVWGDDARVRYQVFAICPAGLAVCHVRVNVTGEGPRATGKLVRWGRLQVGEVDVEAGAGHRLFGVLLEGQMIRTVDDRVDRLAAFVQDLLAAADGRPAPEPE